MEEDHSPYDAMVHGAASFGVHSQAAQAGWFAATLTVASDLQTPPNFLSARFSLWLHLVQRPAET
jgi:hypothetical protein